MLDPMDFEDRHLVIEDSGKSILSGAECGKRTAC